MNQQNDLIVRFRAALPAVQQWIDQTLREHEPRAAAVDTLGFLGLPRQFPPELLHRAKAITVPKVPVPPLREFGLGELAMMEQMPLGGITFKDTFFVHESHRSESLHFHELVHVVQWDRLGVENFLMAYGIGLIEFGYRDSPLEQMAYSLQRNFERRVVPRDLIAFITQRTDAIWHRAAQRLRPGEHGTLA